MWSVEVGKPYRQNGIYSAKAAESSLVKGKVKVHASSLGLSIDSPAGIGVLSSIVWLYLGWRFRP